jgi:hypothetical protein
MRGQADDLTFHATVGEAQGKAERWVNVLDPNA